MNFSLVKGVMVAQQPRGCENSMIYVHSKEIVFHSYVFNDKKQGTITHRMLKTETLLLHFMPKGRITQLRTIVE